MFRCEKCLNEYTKQFDSCPMCGGQIVKFDKPLDPAELERMAQAERLQKERERARTTVNEEFERVSLEVRNGRTIYLYRSFYMSVDSELDSDNKKMQLSPYDDAQVKQAGLFGWRIVGVVPRTSATTLMNYEGFGKTWAGGIGGNVVGSYIMMEYELNKNNLDESAEILRETIKHAYNAI